jgi:tryptophan halogenase
MDYGWMFKIPVWGRHGNGYIFDSDYINAEQAQQEVELHLGKKITVNKQFTFDPGCLEEVWIKNCCAIGVSANFVEPLEASSIGTSIQQSFLLMHRLTRFDNDTIISYNKSVTDIMENIRDFVALHYITDKSDSIFWKDLKKIEIPNTLKSKLDLWKHRLPIKEDFNESSDYILFTDPNFILVMEGLDLFSQESIRDEYHSLNPMIKYEAEQIAANHFYLDQNLNTVSHKEFIKLIRDYF